MAVSSRLFHASPEQVWEVLSDGWLYPVWVVGASRMREVDDAWPAAGSSLHHSVGVWPLLVDDRTEVLESEAPAVLTLRARAWPVGEARVSMHLAPEGAATRVRIEERAVSGPGALLPPPVEGLTLKWRNTETLRRLAYVAERRR